MADAPEPNWEELYQRLRDLVIVGSGETKFSPEQLDTMRPEGARAAMVKEANRHIEALAKQAVEKGFAHFEMHEPSTILTPGFDGYDESHTLVVAIAVVHMKELLALDEEVKKFLPPEEGAVEDVALKKRNVFDIFSRKPVK